jgi:hypothetical protein
MGIKPLTSTKARMDQFRCPSSGSEHVCSDCYLRRLWHEPKYRSTRRNGSYRRFGRGATLARARWAVDKDCLSRRAAIGCGNRNLTLHLSQADLGPCHGSRCAPTISMPALNTSDLKLHGASIGESACRWQASGECTRSHPRIFTARSRSELLHCGDLSAAETHRL